MRRNPRALAFVAHRLMAGVAVWLAAGTAFADIPGEAAIKAAYLVKFAPFVRWPPDAFLRPDAPLVVCVAGTDPFGSLLERIALGQQIDGHGVVVRRMATARRGSGCHVLYVGGSSGQSVAQGLEAVRAEPVLTVTEAEGPRGVISFAMVENHVRFRVDDRLAAADGLKLSSKLLSLAVSVTPR